MNNSLEIADSSAHEATPAIVLSAYQCGPGLGSVSQIGWEWFHRLGKRRKVILVTHVRNRAALEAASDKPANATIVYIDTEWFARPLYNLARRLFPRSEHGVFLVSSIDFFLFDWLALRHLRRLRHTGSRMALVHVVTPVTFAAPSILHRLGLPLVRGPLNCGLESPAGFQTQLRDESPWLIALRNIPRLLDRLVGSSRKAALLLAATRATRETAPADCRHKVVMMSENGIDLEKFAPAEWPPSPSRPHPLQVLFVGRMIALKGVDLLLRAVAGLCNLDLPIRLTLVGDGPLKQEWENLACSLGIRDKVTFTGALDGEGVRAAMRASHVLCLPSVRESGGAVLLEAMATCRPVIAVAHGGPAELVDRENGCAIPAQHPEQVVRDLQFALIDILSAPQGWMQRGRRGRERVEQIFDWGRKITAAEELYGKLFPPRDDNAVSVATPC